MDPGRFGISGPNLCTVETVQQAEKVSICHVIKTTRFPGAIEEGVLMNWLNVVVSLDRKEVIGSV